MGLIKRDGDYIGNFVKKTYEGMPQSRDKSIQLERHDYTAVHVTGFRSNED